MSNPQTTNDGGSTTVRMLHTLDAAAKQFRFYETQHLAKTPPDIAKAQINSDWAENCESAAAAFRKDHNYAKI